MVFSQRQIRLQAAMQVNAGLFPLSLDSTLGHTMHIGDFGKRESAKKL
jgi:hypothetical protein